MFDLSMTELFADTITIEPYSSMTGAQVKTYGTAVSYKAVVVSQYEKTINPLGKEVQSTCRVIIPERVNVDPRSRITLPTGWVPQTPEIIACRPVGGPSVIGLDCTEILL